MKLLSILFTFAFLLTYACSAPADQTTPANKKSDEATVLLTNPQAQAAGIETGRVQVQEFSASIPATGVLDVPPQSRVTVSPPIGGFVKQTDLLQGMKVLKGQVIAVLEHPDYIQLQQDFLDSRSQLTFLEQEKERQLALARDNVNAAKALQQAEAQYRSMKAKTDGLAARLRMIGLDPDKVVDRPLTSTIRVQAPISGYVTAVHVNLGKYAGPDQVMFEIVDTRHLHAELQVFESDLAKVGLDQRVWVKLLNETTEREASVFLIGKEVSSARTVQVHCHFKVQDEHLVPGMYFSARIETDSEKKPVLPADAVVHFEGKSFVFVRVSNEEFRLREVVTSDPASGWVAVTGLDPSLDIVVKGSFYLLSTLRSGHDE